MISRLRQFSPFPLALVALAVCLPGQKGEGVPDVSDDVRAQRIDAGKQEALEAEKRMLANMTPEERLERGTRRGARNHCRFVAACRPEKLAPGQTGILLIAASLQGHSVLPAPAQITIVGRPQQGNVQVGELIAPDAPLGRLHKGYLGRPVFENTALFEVPITMGTNAKLGETELVAIDLKFDIYNGESATPEGRFIERVSTNVEVGVASDPVVEGGRPATGRPVPDRAPEEVVTPARVERQEPVAVVPDQAQSAPDMPAHALPNAPAERAASPDSEEPPVPQGGAVPMPLLLGGGAFLLLIVVLLLMRKK